MNAILIFPVIPKKIDKPHNIKIESLEWSRSYADSVDVELHWFLTDIGFNDDRVESVECRSRDGFSPYSHNKGGLQAYSYRDQYGACENTGFEGCDDILSKYAKYNLEEFLKDNNIVELDYDNEEQLEEFDEYCRSGDDTIQFQVRCMVTSESTLQVDCYVCAKDSPYHRGYDDKLEVEISFKSIAGLKQKLNRLKKNDFIKCLSNNLRECF